MISADFSVGSLKIAGLTLLVMTVSSMYSPVPSCFAVEAQPSAIATNRMPIRVASLRVMSVMRLPLSEMLRGHRARLQPSHQVQFPSESRSDPKSFPSQGMVGRGGLRGPWPRLALPQLLLQRIDERWSLALGGYPFSRAVAKPMIAAPFGHHLMGLNGVPAPHE